MVSVFSTASLGGLANMLGATGNPAIYGKLIFFSNLICYAISAPAFYFAGRSYEKHMNEADMKKNRRVAIES